MAVCKENAGLCATLEGGPFSYILPSLLLVLLGWAIATLRLVSLPPSILLVSRMVFLEGGVERKGGIEWRFGPG